MMIRRTAVLATCWRSRKGRVRAGWMGGEGTLPRRVSPTAERQGGLGERADRLGPLMDLHSTRRGVRMCPKLPVNFW